jgi:hypothetical protein
VAKHYMVDLLMNGDMLFQSASEGHAGSSAKYFSIYRLCNRELGVYKTAYQGGTYVGNDCQKILQNAD